ncbi:GPI ethanolamine phosphate transferase 2 isoform X1 [Pieris napi]|uniref:GPI ethanolamine phosphate transferase 2 isoform X1 n=2 Tax=Pieris napi TaxID=78633 RepID=UPI001FB90AE7|nr:GPI ethanolamine phosphate transferase 2 isoform X1 [Pieris napi]XP_047507598.1 GPI ethanolamine phosphate transferase 2 isoform X1 [Pieris napi]XP_047507605.1 GPI ethanolamine phosphate transferase 2 isoform X1 [Pieris napi]XP_047507614.1 GPI ethanolamine phosphate transferase 2 isoform X1 [Pieris napi]XP_047507622.1 GPI ethanolamine phosphate transferase 2 isoform X1 [Pieris napi]
MLFWLQHKWSGLWLLIFAFGSLTLFLYGFFPLKYHSGKLAHMDDLPNFIDGVSIDGHEVYNSGENSVILMVIDGLRYDFAAEEYMPYTGQLIKNKSACIYVSVAEPPTVTMPRIKSPERKKEKAQWRRTINFWRDIFAMMTGSVSTFADVALNFGAPAVKGDSILRVASSRGRHSVLYGDDTWLRLFPGLWTESDGTTSFFVTDYTEVDNNVTRHLDSVLTPLEDKKPKFDFLVLHYLGLDHIGHLEGARSPKIKPKLIEMDSIVKKIHTAMQTWDRSGVLIICGDHGMRDAGGHGGASPAEVLVPLVVLKSTDFQCPHELGPGPVVAQVDIAPTISWLLNAPIPGDSTGKFLPSLLPSDIRQHLYLLHVNALHNVKQGVPTDTEYYKQFKRAETQFARYLSTGQQSAARIAKEFYDESLAAMSKQLSEATTDFDVFALGLAVVFLYLMLTALVCVTLYSLQPENQRKISVTDKHKTNLGTVVAFAVIFAIVASTLTLTCFITETRSQFCSFGPAWSAAFLASAVALTFAYFLVKTGLEKIRDLSTLRDLNAIDFLLILGTLFHAWSFFGTSFIEEEHMTWYFFWNTLMFFVLVRTIVVIVLYFGKRLSGATEVQEKPELEHRMSDVGVGIVPKWVSLIGLHRYLRTMNQTGDRWLFLPDTADWLNAPENSNYLQAHLIIGTLATLAICLRNIRHMNNHLKIHSVLTILSTLCIFLYRISAGSIRLPNEVPKWDAEQVVQVFWWLLAAQTIFEVITYVGAFPNGNRFVYNKPKAKTEDYYYDSAEEPWNLNDVKLNLARSLTHIMYNQMMLIIVLLMRPHNVIMVPSIYITCLLTAKCLDHKLLDSRPGRNTEGADTLSLTLAHIWIGAVFYFYQGNSNSLASVDLGSGYVGLSEYSPVRVAARMGLHAYAGPALSGAHLFCSLPYTDINRYRQAVWRVTNIMALQRVYQVVIYCVIAIIFRHHLFVWSVFSPKLLYDFVATIFSVQALLTIAEIVCLTHVVSWISRCITYRRVT